MTAIARTGPHYASPESRFAAIRARDPAADGHFVFAVLTTGVYCNPSCVARPARPENISFYPAPKEAERAGYRPCQRCRPDLGPRAAREAAIVAEACRAMEADEAGDLASLAARAGMSAAHFHRLFRKITGVTPGAYARAQRQTRVQAELAQGAGVTEALYGAGFGSSGRFYEASDAMLGMVPSRYRSGGAGEVIRFATGLSRLGSVLVAEAGRGICAILIGSDPAALEADLRARFPKAQLAAAEPGFAETVRRVVGIVDDPKRQPNENLPLDIRGTAFQCLVWEALRAIPAGETLSYAELARRIGQPRAVRAVAGACAANRLAVAVPCHRAVASNGELAGYRWGAARKRALLEQERS